MTAPEEKMDREPEPYGIFGTFIQYQPGEHIWDLRGNMYKVMDSSTYNRELEMYDTPAQFLQSRSDNPNISEAIEALGTDIHRMTEAEVLAYVDLNIQDTTFEFDEYELEKFATQEPPTFSQEEWQVLVDAPLDVPEGDITENARHALTEFDIDINKVIQELDTPDTYEPETKIDLNYQDDFGR